MWYYPRPIKCEYYGRQGCWAIFRCSSGYADAVGVYTWDLWCVPILEGFPGGSVVKKAPASAGDAGLIPGSGGSSPGGRKGQPSPVFLPGTSHGQRNLEGYSVHVVAKELDMTTTATCPRTRDLWFRKMVLMNLSVELQWRCRHRKQTHGHSRGKRGRDELKEQHWNILIMLHPLHILPCVKGMARGNLLFDAGSSNRCSVTT